MYLNAKLYTSKYNEQKRNKKLWKLVPLKPCNMDSIELSVEIGVIVVSIYGFKEKKKNLRFVQNVNLLIGINQKLNLIRMIKNDKRKF